MKQIIVIFLIIPIAYGMEKQGEQSKPTFVPGHRRTHSISSFTDPRLKELSERLPQKETILPRQSSDLPIDLNPINLHGQITELKKRLNDSKETIKELTTKNDQLTHHASSLEKQLKQPNVFVRFYVATTLSCMIGTLAYFTYPQWSRYIRDALPHLLHYKK